MMPSQKKKINLIPLLHRYQLAYVQQVARMPRLSYSQGNGIQLQILRNLGCCRLWLVRGPSGAHLGPVWDQPAVGFY